MDALVLVAGDGDFKDMITFVHNTMKKPVFIIGYKASMSAALVKIVTESIIIYLDEIWDSVLSSKSDSTCPI